LRIFGVKLFKESKTLSHKDILIPDKYDSEKVCIQIFIMIEFSNAKIQYFKCLIQEKAFEIYLKVEKFEIVITVVIKVLREENESSFKSIKSSHTSKIRLNINSGLYQ
jgi:hypothetical protein